MGRTGRLGGLRELGGRSQSSDALPFAARVTWSFANKRTYEPRGDGVYGIHISFNLYAADEEFTCRTGSSGYRTAGVEVSRKNVYTEWDTRERVGYTRAPVLLAPRAQVLKLP